MKRSFLFALLLICFLAPAFSLAMTRSEALARICELRTLLAEMTGGTKPDCGLVGVTLPSNLATYKNVEYGFEVQYPKSWGSRPSADYGSGDSLATVNFNSTAKGESGFKFFYVSIYPNKLNKVNSLSDLKVAFSGMHGIIDNLAVGSTYASNPAFRLKYLENTENRYASEASLEREKVYTSNNNYTFRIVCGPGNCSAQNMPRLVFPKTQEEKQVGYITKVYKTDNQYYLKIDYIQWFSGDAAIQAAQKDNGPGFRCCDNGYYIRNVNPLIRTFKITPTAVVQLATAFSDNPTGKKTISLAEFKRLIDEPQGKAYHVPFWIHLTGDNVTQIVEQYIP